MDEPTGTDNQTGLIDPAATNRVAQPVPDLRGAHSIFVITQMKTGALRIADRVAMFFLGRRAWIGPVVQMCRQPAVLQA